MFNKHLVIIVLSLLCVMASMRSRAWQEHPVIKRYLCVFLCLFFIIQAGFRDYEHQLNDTINYWNSFENLKEESLSQLLQQFSFSYKEYSDRDPGYHVFVKFTQLIWPDFRFFLVLVACIITVPIFTILYKYTPTVSGVLLGAILYEALFAPFFETGIRQAISMGLSYCALFAFMKDRKVLSIILFLVGFSIHTTALIFSPIFFLINYKRPEVLLRISLILAPVFMFFAKPIVAFIGAGTIFSNYAIDSENNLGTPVFSLLVFLSAFAARYYSARIVKKNDYKLLFLGIVMALMLTPASWVDSNFIRLAFYYLVFLMPLMSVVIENAVEVPSMKSLLYAMVTLVFIYIS